MPPESVLLAVASLLPAVSMLAAVPVRRDAAAPAVWRRFRVNAGIAVVAAALSLGLQLAGPAPSPTLPLPGLALTLTAAWVALLVQTLGTVIGVFSARYLHGEVDQPRCVAALGGVLAAVHLLLLADHWLVLIAAWAAVGWAMQQLLCFYRDRPFALLAAHKKRVADRLADVLLVTAALLAWHAVGSGSLSAMWRHLEAGAPSPALQASAVCMALAVVLRTALLPVHGWLIQVMEAPTPVSALLHAGVINLGGYVLIRFAPLLDAVPAAQWLLVACGLITAMLAGLVMLTRVSIKVQLAWSTVAQMGFMVMECALGLYTLALLHLLGHSLYKAHAFLAASGAVESARLRTMRGATSPSAASLVLAPLGSGALIAALLGLQSLYGHAGAWPWWWGCVLALAWAPLLWLPAQRHPEGPGAVRGLLAGAAMVTGLALAALSGHALPLGTADAPHAAAGLVAMVGMAALYLCLALLNARPGWMATWRRWSYAGFYIDEYATRAALRLSPSRWTPVAPTECRMKPREEPPCRPC